VIPEKHIQVIKILHLIYPSVEELEIFSKRGSRGNSVNQYEDRKDLVSKQERKHFDLCFPCIGFMRLNSDHEFEKNSAYSHTSILSGSRRHHILKNNPCIIEVREWCSKEVDQIEDSHSGIGTSKVVQCHWQASENNLMVKRHFSCCVQAQMSGSMATRLLSIKDVLKKANTSICKASWITRRLSSF
jgi:hypothetical protein